MNETTTIKVESLMKKFDEHTVLKDINLNIQGGQFIALMGASGSGKSTLLNIIGALIPSSEGKVEIMNKEITGEAMREQDLADVRSKNIAWIFQDFHLIENLTALENVLVPLNLSGTHGIEAENRAKELLVRVGLEDRMDHFPDGLSGGQQQRVAIARALANDPPIILADEPTGNLDTQTGLEIIALFKSLQDQGKSVLMVSHDPSLAFSADKVLILKNGTLHEELEVVL